MATKTYPKITEIQVTPIAIVDPPLLNAAGVHAPYALRTIIELVNEDGVSGISEIPGDSEVNQALLNLESQIIGRDPYQLNNLFDVLKELLGDESARGDAPWDQRRIVHVFSALEVACLDMIGKMTNRPVVDLLGGRRRDQVPFAAYLFYKFAGAGGTWGMNQNPDAKDWDAARQCEAIDPAGIVAQAEAMCAAFGFKSIKLKGGAFPPEEETDAIFALSEAFGPEVPLRLDPNAIWSLDTGIKYGKVLTPVLEYLEDPVRGQKNMAQLRKELGVLLATNMCTTSFDELPTSFQLHSEDIILSDHHFWGGLRASMELARICSHFGRKLSMHSNSHLGISMAAMTHLGAAIPDLVYALDTHYPWQSEDVIVGGKMKIEEGNVAVPAGPGLGVELDRAALHQLHQNYLACGLTTRNDEIEMQKIDPQWRFMATRW